MAKAGNNLDELVSRAKTRIEKHTSANLSIEELAVSLGLSCSHFRRVFKLRTGLAPYQYHLHLRIERAKRMLRGTSTSIREIASALAFEGPFHFSNAFKRKTGMAPTIWRQQQNGHATNLNAEASSES